MTRVNRHKGARGKSHQRAGTNLEPRCTTNSPVLLVVGMLTAMLRVVSQSEPPDESSSTTPASAQAVALGLMAEREEGGGVSTTAKQHINKPSYTSADRLDRGADDGRAVGATRDGGGDFTSVLVNKNRRDDGDLGAPDMGENSCTRRQQEGRLSLLWRVPG